MVEAKHEFVDDYPYLVYTNEDTLVYSNKTDTSIDDVSGGGEHSIYCFIYQNNQATPIDDSPIALAKKGNQSWTEPSDPTFVDKAVAGCVLYAMPCTVNSSDYVPFYYGTGKDLSEFASISKLDSISAFCMVDGDLGVMYVPAV